MSETASIPNLLLTTPMRDLLRLRLTGRLAWRKAVRTSALPADVRRLIGQTVTRSRLWRLEKADVAEELISHFAEGLQRGRPSTDLIAEFGDPATAATLIRRAKLRNRGLPGKILWLAKWATVTVLLLAAFLIVRFFMAHPTVSVNYFTQVNRLALTAPPDNLAWPIYQQAIDTMGKPGHRVPWLSIDPGSPQDKQMMQWVSDHPATIATIQNASAKPVLGFILKPGAAPHDQNGDARPPTAVRIGIMGAMLSYLTPMRCMANLIVCDMQIARLHGDGNRFSRDANVLFNMAHQLEKPGPFIVGNMVGMGLDLMAFDQMDRALAGQPALLSDDQLNQLAKRMARPQTAADFADLQTERLAAADLAQRVFSGNGIVGGRITATGMATLREMEPMFHLASDVSIEHKALTSGPVPLSALTLVSRDEFLATFDQLIDGETAELRQPFRSVARPTAFERLYAKRQSTWFMLRYGLLMDLFPDADYARVAAERLLGRRDGLLIGVGLELFHRRHGYYPATLDELSCLLPPTMPVDRFTGQPLHYKLVAGRPLVYSVGADRVDNGGKPAIAPGSRYPDANAAADFFSDNPPRGDWILYPQSRIEKDD